MKVFTNILIVFAITWVVATVAQILLNPNDWVLFAIAAIVAAVVQITLNLRRNQ